MRNYVEAVLDDGEIIEFQAELSWWSLWLWIGLAGLYGISAVYSLSLVVDGEVSFSEAVIPTFISLFFVVITRLRRSTTELVITNKRLIAKTGIISTKTIELQLSNAEGVEIQQSIIGNLANYGTVYISGLGSSRVPIKGIIDPIYFRCHLSKIQERYKK